MDVVPAQQFFPLLLQRLAQNAVRKGGQVIPSTVIRLHIRAQATTSDHQLAALYFDLSMAPQSEIANETM